MRQPAPARKRPPATSHPETTESTNPPTVTVVGRTPRRARAETAGSRRRRARSLMGTSTVTSVLLGGTPAGRPFHHHRQLPARGRPGRAIRQVVRHLPPPELLVELGELAADRHRPVAEHGFDVGE